MNKKCVSRVIVELKTVSLASFANFRLLLGDISPHPIQDIINAIIMATIAVNNKMGAPETCYNNVTPE